MRKSLRDNELRLERAIPFILKWLRVRRAVPARRAEVELAFLPNAALRRLKRTYLRKDAPVVDVLSFPAITKTAAGKPAPDFPSPDAPRGRLGEVYLNRAIAARDPDRALFLLVHGILHLCGYDHRLKRDTMEMEKLEQAAYLAVRGKF